MSNLEGSELRYAVLIAASLPFSMLYYELFVRRSYRYRHLYTILVAAFLVWAMWGWPGILHGTLHIIFVQLASYFEIDPIVIMAACMVHLFAAHYYNQIYHGRLETYWTILLMILTERSSWLTIAQSQNNRGGKTNPSTIVGRVAYSCLFPGVLSLPAGNYADYMTLDKKHHPLPKDDRLQRYRRALYTIAGSLLSVIISLALKNKFPAEGVVSDGYFRAPFWYQMLFLYLVQIGHRCGYYYVWLMGEASFVLMGFGRGPEWYKF